MFDYIDDLGLSSLFIDDVDHAFVPQDDLAAFESRDAYYVLPSGPGSSSSGIPRELFDNPLAALMPVAQPPHGPDAMMHEHLINGITPWFFATPGNQGPPPASTPCDTFFAPNFVAANEGITFGAFDSIYSNPIHSEPCQFGLDQPRYFVIDTHAPRLPPAAATARTQHHKNVTPPVKGMRRSRKHVCNIAPCNGATFGRGPELRRHHASKHDVARFWCPIDGCHRSKMEGGRAFARKDKMVDHLMKVHGDRVGSTA